MSGDKRHDSLFKHTFSQLPAAREQLHAQLPAEIAALVDWGTLCVRQGSFVDQELASVHTDLLFEAQLLGQGRVLLYLLFEHQRSPEPIMAMRLLRYMLSIWTRWLTENEGSLPVPFIVPLVLYNGERRWDVSMQLSGLFPEQHRGLFSPYLPEFSYRLLDLCRTPDAELRGMALRHLTLVWLKRGGEEGFWQQVPSFSSALRQLMAGAGGLHDLSALLRYLVYENPRVIPDDIKRTLAQFAPQSERWFVTWAEQLREEGREEERKRAEEERKRAQEAIARAEEERQRAEEQARLHLGKLRQRTLTALRRKFGELPEAAIDTVQSATEAQLDAIDAGLDAASTLSALLG